VAASIVAASPASPISVTCGVIARSASPSVMPLILEITQKPLSFIQGNGLEPQRGFLDVQNILHFPLDKRLVNV